MNDSSKHTLRVENLSRSFGVGDGAIDVLHDLSMDLDGGESMAITGPSGSGKSTLLQILGTLDRPDTGQVLINDTDPFSLNEKELAKFRNETIGFVFQDHHLLPQLNILENLLVPALAFGRPSKEQLEQATSLIEAVGLADRVSHLPGELSGGQRERVAIARSLVMSPSLILADEPTGNLDRKTAEEITTLLLDLQKSSGAILIVVTHSDSLAQAMNHQRELSDGWLKASNVSTK